MAVAEERKCVPSRNIPQGNGPWLGMGVGDSECGPCCEKQSPSVEVKNTPATPSLSSESPGTNPPPMFVDYATNGAAELDRAAKTAHTPWSVGVSLPTFPLSGGCGGSGPCFAYMDLDGRLLVDVGPPATGGLAALSHRLIYNSQAQVATGTASLVAWRWGGVWDRVLQSSGGVTSLTSPSGAVQSYTGTPSIGYYTPGAGAANGLKVVDATHWRLVQPNGFWMDFTADAGGIGRPSSLGNPANCTWTISRDGGQRIKTVLDPTGQTTTYTYDANGLSRIQDAAGRNTDFLVNGSGDLIGVTSPELCVTSLAYDGSHRLTRYISPDQVVTTFGYDGSDRLTKVQTSDGLVTISYSGSSVAVQNARGFVGTYVKDGNGRLESYTSPLNERTTYAWDHGWPRSITNPLGEAYTFTYQQMQTDGGTWRLSSVQRPTGGVFSYVYDATDKVVAFADELLNRSTLTWDGGNRTNFQNAQGKITTYAYGACGQMTSITDPLGHTRTLGYDADRRHVTDTNPLGLTTTYTYDAAGLRLSAENPLGQTASVQRNGMNQITVAVDPLGHRTSYTYAPGCLLLATQDAQGCRTSLIHDPRGRVEATVDPLGRRTSYTFDAAGNRTAIVNPLNERTSLAYDGANRQVTSQNPLGFVTTVNYDAVGRPTAVANPLGETNQTLYTADGLVRARVNPLGDRTTFTYDAAGGMQTTQNPLGYVWTTVYDRLRRVERTVNPLGAIATNVYDAADRTIEVVNALGRVSTTVYDAADRTIARVDPLGARTSYMFDKAGRPTETQNPLNYVWTTSYDAAGRTTAEINPLGFRTSSTYDAVNRRTEVQNPLGYVSTTVYDCAGQTQAAVDPLGLRTSYTYDLAGRRRTLQNPLSFTWTTSYDAAGQVRTTTDPLGFGATFTYDAAGRQLTTQNPLGFVRSTAYDGAGRVNASVDPLGNRTTFAYDQAGQRTGVQNPLGFVSTTVYDPAGQAVGQVDPLGFRTTFTFDLLGQVTESINALGRVMTSVYDRAGRLAASVNALNYRTTFTYDDAGQQTAVTNPLGKTRTTVFDPAGRVIANVNPLGQRTSSSYDAAGQQTAVTNPLAFVWTSVYDAAGRPTAAVNPLGFRTTFAYDAAGQQTAVQDANLHVTTTFYDPRGLVEATQNALSYRTTQVYDPAGRRIAQVDARFYRTSFQYDAADRLETQLDPLNRQTTFQYDAAGQQTRRIDPRGVGTTYSYDPVGRLTGRRYTNDPPVTFAYDAVGNRTRMEDGTGRTTYTYDELDRTRSVVNPSGLGITYTYTALDQRATMQAPNGGLFTYGYDAADRIETLLNPQSGRTTWTYDAGGRRIRQQQANGTEATYTYDRADQLTRLANFKSDGTVLAAFDYTYDAAGNRTVVDAASLSIPAGRTTWTYDAANQLTNEHRTAAWGPFQITHVYDPVGNRLVKNETGAVTTYSYDPANQLLTSLDGTGTTNYSFDGAGNQTRVVAPGGAIATSVWDDENRRTLVVEPAGGRTTMAFNGEDLRTLKQVGAETTKFVWDGQNYLLETNGVNAIQRVYTNEPQVYGNLLSHRTDDDRTCHYHFDGQGSTSVLTDQSQTFRGAFILDAFGNTVDQDDVTFDTPFLYVGRLGYYHDASLLDYYVRRRPYSPRIARWLAVDPLGRAEACYRYARNAPQALIDPSGLVDINCLEPQSSSPPWGKTHTFELCPPKTTTSIELLLQVDRANQSWIPQPVPDLCGPDVTDWFVDELNIHAALFRGMQAVFRKEFEWLPQGAVRALYFAPYGATIPYKWMNFSAASGGTKCPSHACAGTVELCGTCIDRSELGNIMLGASAGALGLSEYQVLWGVTRPQLGAAASNTVEDMAGIVAGLILSYSLANGPISQRTLCASLGNDLSGYIRLVTKDWEASTRPYQLLKALSGKNLSDMGAKHSHCSPCPVACPPLGHSDFASISTSQHLARLVSERHYFKVYGSGGPEPVMPITWPEEFAPKP